MISRLPSSWLAPMSPFEVNWEHLSSERELQSNMRANMKFNILKHFQNQHCLKEASSVLWQTQCHQLHGSLLMVSQGTFYRLLGRSQGTHLQNPPEFHVKKCYGSVFPLFFLTKIFFTVKRELQSWTHYKCTFNWCVNFGVQIRSFYWRVNKKKFIKATIRASCPEKVPFLPLFPSFSFSGDQREHNWGRILEVWSVLCYLSACLSVITVILELVTS